MVHDGPLSGRDFGDGIREIAAAAEAGVAFNDRRLAGFTGHDERARMRNRRLAATRREVQHVDRRFQHEAARQMDEGPTPGRTPCSMP